MHAISAILKKLDSDYVRGYGLSPLPNQIDMDVESLIDVLQSVSAESLRAELNETHGFVLASYAERMASLAVRREDSALLSKAMAALVVAESVMYVKELLPVLSIIYNSATKIGVDWSELTSAVRPSDGSQFGVYVANFLERALKDQSINAMGYIEDRDEGGFRYRRTW